MQSAEIHLARELLILALGWQRREGEEIAFQESVRWIPPMPRVVVPISLGCLQKRIGLGISIALHGTKRNPFTTPYTVELR
jgi:hypothetical protein